MPDPHPAFAPILGQPDAIAFLSRALAADRLPHGLIFAGPEGVGRHATAVALAKIFLAETPEDPASIDRVSPLIDARTHPDFHLVNKEQVRELEGKSANKAIQFSIDVVRERILAPAGRKSALGVGKVFVVEDADALNTQAQNALLKTLEEPAGRTLIVLLSDQPNALLSTVRSRAQIVRFHALSVADARAVLARNGVTDEGEADAAIALANGAPGLALRWLQDGVVAQASALEQLLDAADAERASADLAAFLKQASDAYAAKQTERDPLGSEDGFRRAGINVYLRLAADHLRRRLTTTDARTIARACDGIDAIRRAESYIDANVNAALVMQQVSAALAR